ncbi:MAG: hypothetical protein U0U67_13840 [Chitinophagales bacterium]
MRSIVYLFLLAFAGCNSPAKEHANNKSTSVAASTAEDVSVSYDSLKQSIVSNKKDIDHIDLTASAVAKRFVMKNLLNLFPYWYGTKWNFNGATEIPQQGSIACGYFVTTLLRDAGLNINRIKLAQQASSVIIQAVCDKENIKTFSNAKNENFFKYIKEQGEAIYIIGLDFHTGFIYFDGKEIYFIQSKYYEEVAVVKELAEQSRVLLTSKFKMLGRIDNSEKAGKLFINK